MKIEQKYVCGTCGKYFIKAELCKHNNEVLKLIKDNPELSFSHLITCVKCCDSDIIRGLGIKIA